MSKEPNLHNIDRAARLIIGIGCVYIGFIDTSLIANRIVAILVGVFGTANLWAFFTRRCPVYTVAGFSTVVKPKHTVEPRNSH